MINGSIPIPAIASEIFFRLLYSIAYSPLETRAHHLNTSTQIAKNTTAKIMHGINQIFSPVASYCKKDFAEKATTTASE